MPATDRHTPPCSHEPVSTLWLLACSGCHCAAAPLPSSRWLGVVSLIAFAVVLTRVDSAFAGRAYAAYGGIYIAASLVWLWLAEGQRPTVTDILGAGIAIVGPLVIIGFATKAK